MAHKRAMLAQLCYAGFAASFSLSALGSPECKGLVYSKAGNPAAESQPFWAFVGCGQELLPTLKREEE